MDDLKILALGDDTPIARWSRPYKQRRATFTDAEGWNLMAAPRPVARDVVEYAPPGSIAARALEWGK